MNVVLPEGVAERLSEDQRREHVIETVRAFDDGEFEDFVSRIDKANREDLFTAAPEFRWRFLEILAARSRRGP